MGRERPEIVDAQIQHSLNTATWVSTSKMETSHLLSGEEQRIQEVESGPSTPQKRTLCNRWITSSTLEGPSDKEHCSKCVSGLEKQYEEAWQRNNPGYDLDQAKADSEAQKKKEELQAKEQEDLIKKNAKQEKGMAERGEPSPEGPPVPIEPNAPQTLDPDPAKTIETQEKARLDANTPPETPDSGDAGAPVVDAVPEGTPNPANSGHTDPPSVPPAPPGVTPNPGQSKAQPKK